MVELVAMGAFHVQRHQPDVITQPVATVINQRVA
jgi:hypothetical protein